MKDFFIFIGFVVLFFLFFWLFLLIPPPANYGSPNSVVNIQRIEEDGSAIGMTYSGKIGINLGNGFVMPMDGSGMQIGFEL